MKKKISFLMVAMLLFALLADCRAEEQNDFVYRNGIHFGDSIEDVRQKEPDTHQGLDENNLQATEMTLSGFSGCALNYFFENGKLNVIRIFYCRDNMYDKANITASFDTIDDGLTRKYGEPITGYNKMEIPPEGLIYLYRNKHKDFITILTANQRTVSCDGYDVIIEHVLAEGRSTNADGKEEKYYINGVTYVQVINDNDIVDNDL